MYQLSWMFTHSLMPRCSYLSEKKKKTVMKNSIKGHILFSIVFINNFSYYNILNDRKIILS
jgi:hypothetical protein